MSNLKKIVCTQLAKSNFFFFFNKFNKCFYFFVRSFKKVKLVFSFSLKHDWLKFNKNYKAAFFSRKNRLAFFLNHFFLFKFGLFILKQKSNNNLNRSNVSI